MEECANWDKGKTKTFCIRDNTQVCPVGIVAITLSFFPVGSRPDEVTYCGAVRKGYSRLSVFLESDGLCSISIYQCSATNAVKVINSIALSMN
jgi:hypothetical protein